MKPIASLKKHSIISYSIFLVLAVTGAIFWNSYYSLQKFGESTDALLISKAGLAERVFGVFSSEYFSSPEMLQEKILALKKSERDISGIAVYVQDDGGEGFRAIASTKPEDIGTVQNEIPYLLAWNDTAGSAFVSSENGKRHWNIFRRVEENGKKSGLIFFQLSLEENDAFIRAAMRQSYLVALVTLLAVLLLLFNHLRFSQYAIRAARLEEVDRMKDDFISMASHELKSPISILRGYADLLKGEKDDGVKRDYTEKMDMTLERLATLVDDLLDVSRLEQNRLPIRISSINLVEILRAISSDYAMEAKNKGLEFHFEETSVSLVLGDPDRAKQIIVNLLSNAVKYTVKGKVEVALREEKERVVLTVADTGLGISAENMEKLFTKFYRVQTSETEKISGTGLGLWIAREIARKMGGDLTAESIQGVGSHFSVSFKKSNG